MADFPISVAVTRTELSLTDLDLNDGVNFSTFGMGPGTRARRNVYNTSGNVTGATLNNSVLDLIVRPLIVRVLGTSGATFDANVQALVDAFEQSSFQLKETKNGTLTTYDCLTCPSIGPADPTGSATDEWDRDQLIRHRHLYRLAVPTQPQPSTGPI